MSFPYPEDLATLNQEEPNPMDMVAPEEPLLEEAPVEAPAPEEEEDIRAEDKIEDDDLKADINAICNDLDNADQSLRNWRRLYKLAMLLDGDQILYYDDQLQSWAPASVVLIPTMKILT
jgi:hypothetical protein